MPVLRTDRATPTRPSLGGARRVGLALPALLLSASLATACQEAAEARAYPHLADLPALGLEEQLRIGSLEDPDVGFSNVGPIWLDAGGEVFVQETAELQIRVYAAAGNDAGRLLRSYRAAGRGARRVPLHLEVRSPGRHRLGGGRRPPSPDPLPPLR